MPSQRTVYVQLAPVLAPGLVSGLCQIKFGYRDFSGINMALLLLFTFKVANFNIRLHDFVAMLNPSLIYNWSIINTVI